MVLWVDWAQPDGCHLCVVFPAGAVRKSSGLESFEDSWLCARWHFHSSVWCFGWDGWAGWAFQCLHVAFHRTDSGFLLSGGLCVVGYLHLREASSRPCVEVESTRPCVKWHWGSCSFTCAALYWSKVSRRASSDSGCQNCIGCEYQEVYFTGSHLWNPVAAVELVYNNWLIIE